MEFDKAVVLNQKLKPRVKVHSNGTGSLDSITETCEVPLVPE